MPYAQALKEATTAAAGQAPTVDAPAAASRATTASAVALGHATTLGNTVVLGAALLAAVVAVQRYTHVLDAPGSRFVLERERCHGIVRAGRNDCGTSRHACAGQASADAQADEWISLPAGTCERIAAGRLRGGGGSS